MTHAEQDATKPGTRPAWMIPTIAAGIAVLVGLAVLITLLLTRSSTSRVAVKGRLTLAATGNGIYFGQAVSDGQLCSGAGGYSDLAGGVQVVITDDAGKILTAVPLDDGRARDGRCVFTFEASVPGGRQNYGVTVSHRGTIIFSPDRITEPSLTIGP